MEIKLKIYKLFSIVFIFYMQSIFSSGLMVIEENNSIDIIEEEILIEKYNKNNQILFNSIVYLSANKKNYIDDFKEIGAFIYKLNSDESNNNLQYSTQSSQKELKLVKMISGKYMISDGSFIIEFKNKIDKERFNMDYSLETKFVMGERTAYHSEGFKNLENLFDQFQKDERIISYELDLIDPNIALR